MLPETKHELVHQSHIFFSINLICFGGIQDSYDPSMGILAPPHLPKMDFFFLPEMQPECTFKVRLGLKNQNSLIILEHYKTFLVSLLFLFL